MARYRCIAVVALLVLSSSGLAAAEIAVAAGDGKVELVDGVQRVVRPPRPDIVSVLDLAANPPKVLGEVAVPNSFAGPGSSVAISPDQSLALVTSGNKLDPADPAKQIPDNRLTVIALDGGTPRVLVTLETGSGPAGVAISPRGDVALTANRYDGTLSIFAIAGRAVTPAGSLILGDAKSTPSAIAFTRDGRSALVTRAGDNRTTILAVDGTKVTATARDLYTGVRPFAIEVAGTVAVVTNNGVQNGDVDTVSLIDLAAQPPRTVDTVMVGETPEGLALSPDGLLCAVVVLDGSNKPRASPFFHDAGRLVLFRIDGKRLVKFAEAPVGHWSQGVIFGRDSRTLYVQNRTEREIQVLRTDGSALVDTGIRLAFVSDPSGMRAAGAPR